MIGPVNAFGFAALLPWFAALSTIDIRTRRLPDLLTAPGAVSIIAVAAATGRGPVAVGGALLLATPYLLIHLIAPAACGGGDVKLALGTGAAAACGGAQCWVWAAVGAPLLTALAGVGILLGARCAGRVHASIVPGPAPPARIGGAALTVPHGPAMCLATVAALWSTV